MKKKGMMRFLSLLLMAALVLSVQGTDTKAAKKKYVKSLKVSKTTVSLAVGAKAKIKATVKVSGKVKKTVSVKSSNKSVAKVKAGKANTKGVTSLTITAVKAGSANVTVTTKSKGKNKKVLKKTIRVTVKGSSFNTGSTGGTSGKTTGTSGNGSPSTGTPSTGKPSTDTPSTDTPSTDNPTQEEPVSPEVKWSVTEEKFTGYYSYQNEETGLTENLPKELTRKYVSFNPWPTTNAQIEYVIKNCDDPFVVGSLYVVALDNFVYNGLGNYTGEVYKMLDTLMSGAGTVTGSSYQLSNYAKQQICGFGNKQVLCKDGTALNVSTFASRAYLKGATPYNNYTPEGGMADKTKWQIVMDEYVYCGDLAKGYITVCPQRYTEETDGGEQKVMEHWQGIRIGMRWNKTAQVWLPTDNTALNTAPTGALTPFNVEKQVLFSSNYMAPVADQGF